jgi:Cft2 family RNA processing exonuclease
MIKFLPLGGAGEIGASCFYLNIDDTGIILDCGLHPQKTGIEALPKFDLIKNLPLDYCLISHAHQDHLSGVPFLVQKHPYIKIITTPQTRAISELTLHNSISIMKEQIEGEDNYIPNIEKIKIYSHEEVYLLIQSIDYKSYRNIFRLEGYNKKESIPITAEFFDAGHVLGSASILIEYKGKKIFYTGDINLNDQALIKGASLPKDKIDTLILETTYGATDSSKLSHWKAESDRLAVEINKILVNGGSVLIPVFSLGKMQEILTVLWNLMVNKKLIQTDIFTGGIAQKISRVYDYNRYVVNMIDPQFEISSIPQKDLYEVENPEIFFKNPCIVLAPSGMMIENTASFYLAQYWIKQANSAIFTVGYMEKTTPGFKFASATQGSIIEIGIYSEQVKCKIKNFRFSAHSRREDLLEIVKRLKPKNVILVHGDKLAINWMSSSLLKEFEDIKLHVAEIGKQIIL